MPSIETIDEQLALHLSAKLAGGESLADVLADLAARQENVSLWRVSGFDHDSDRPRQQLCLWSDEAAVNMAAWRELSTHRAGSYQLASGARQVKIKKITLAAAHDIISREPLIATNLAKSLARLPPYTVSEIEQAAKKCNQVTPERVWAWVDYENIPLLLGRDADGSPKVNFPAAWPAGPGGRADWHVQCMSTDWREERALGTAYRPRNWIVPVARVVEENKVRWGLIDLEGRFVLPCEYSYLSRPEGWLGGEPPSLPEGRREPWLWVMARREPLVLPDDAPAGAYFPLTAATCDVIEVWSGVQVNPPGIKALAETFEWGKFLVRGADDNSDTPRLGRMQAGQAEPGPLAWCWIAHCLTHSHTPAQDANTGLYAYIDSKGETVFPPRYADAHRFNSGIAVVRLTDEEAQADGVMLNADGLPFAPWGVINETGNWVLAPHWRAIEDEYDGHFMVQSADASWGVVTPAGETVVPFLKTMITEAIGEWLKERFKWEQNRRFRLWMRAARSEESLAVFTGKLHSSYGAYDYGALPNTEEGVLIIRPVMVTGQYYASKDEGPRQVQLEVGMRGRWSPGARHYAHFVDLSTHAVVEIDGLDVHALQIPWDALSLLPAPPAEFDDPILAARFHRLQEAKHRDALIALIEAFEKEKERRYSIGLAAEETKPPEPIDPKRPWSGRMVEPVSLDGFSSDDRTLNDYLLNLYFLDASLNRNDAHSFGRNVGRLEQATPPAASPEITVALKIWLTLFKESKSS